MKPIQEALVELRRTVLSIILLNSVVDSVVIFALFFLVMILIAVDWLYAFIPFGVYLIVHTVSGLRRVEFRSIERKLPDFQDQLTTAADTAQKDNPVLEEFRQELLSRMRQIRNSYFINFKKITLRLLTLVLISFVTIFVSAAGIRLFDFNQVMDAASRSGLNPFARYGLNESLLSFEENQSIEDILGNKSVAELGYEELQLQLSPVQSDVDISRIEEPENKQFSTTTPPTDIGATTDATYEENIPKDYRRIVKNYFSQISKAQ